MFENINASGFQQEISRNTDAVILDVRTPEEFNSGHLENAINIDFKAHNFSLQINQLSKDTPYLIYCRSGARSFNACMLMQNMGFKKVVNLKGGILDWNYAIV